MAGAGRGSRGTGYATLIADHPLRLPGGRARESRRPVRRNGDRRDSDAANHDHDRGGEARDGRGRRARPRAARTDRGAHTRPTDAAAWNGTEPSAVPGGAMNDWDFLAEN